MIECFVRENTLPEAYHTAIDMLSEFGELSPCDDWDTTQKEVSMTMVVEHPTQEPMISKLFIGGPRELEQYRQEMLDGILDFEVKKGNWAYTYHDRMVNYPIDNQEEKPEEWSLNQIDFVIKELNRNPSSRRAVILIRDNSEDAYSDDPACLQHIQYFIRNNKLHCKVLFRSNDACKATYMNAFALIQLQQQIANELSVEVGSYVHRASSFHCYEKDFCMLDGYCKRIHDAINKNDIYSISADYHNDDDGGWYDMMEECKPEIQAMIDELSRR